ncbi:hypothetical protein KFE98_06565 [bacterium SCSIO 12741]|nr:hypothetical protein KFE98_06565 [bacterium SCSIO 12741]
MESKSQKAKAHARKNREEMKEIENQAFDYLTSGWPWRISQLIALLSLFFSLTILIDYWLPVEQVGEQVASKKFYNSMHKSPVYYANDSSEYIPNEIHVQLDSGDLFLRNFSPFLHEFQGYSIVSPEGDVTEINDEINLFTLYPLIPLLYLLPLLLLRFKRNSNWFYLLYFLLYAGYLPVFLHQMLIEGKLLWFLEGVRMLLLS